MTSRKTMIKIMLLMIELIILEVHANDLAPLSLPLPLHYQLTFIPSNLIIIRGRLISLFALKDHLKNV
jgi:hypothetical protein